MVININTENALRRSGNGQQRIFCKVSLPDEGYVLKTVPLGGITLGTLAKKPLRLIVARTPVTCVDRWHTGTYYLDTLSCGHQITTYSFEAEKKRRGCQDCLDAMAVPLPERKAA